MDASTPFMRLHGARMSDAGYHIVPLWAGKKCPGQFANGYWGGHKGWERFAIHKPIDAMVDVWSYWPGCGVGIVTGGASGVIGIDIDIMDTEVAQKVSAAIQEKLGPTPLVRQGLPPKVMLVYRTSAPLEKISLQPIEVLATGQQFVAYGVHPTTQKPYQWLQEAPENVPVDTIPQHTPEAIRAAAEAAYALIPEELKPKQRLTGGQGTHVHSENEPPATTQAIESACRSIPNTDLSWDDWNYVGMAIFAASHGSAEGQAIWESWSQLSPKYQPKETAERWQSYRRSPPQQLGFGTLHHIAKKCGWQPPAGLAFNVAKDTSDVDTTFLDSLPVENPRPVEAAKPILAPAAPERKFRTVRDVLATTTDIAKRNRLLHAVGLHEDEVVDPKTGEITSLIAPIVHTNEAVSDFVESSLQTVVEGEHDTPVIVTSIPERLSLTKEEIDHGTLPRSFIDKFPQKFLFTDSLVGKIAKWIDDSSPMSHRVFSLMASFTLFSALTGRQYRTLSGIRPTLSCIIVAGSGSGKEGARSAATRLLSEAGLDNLIGPRGGFSSGSGVIEGLRKSPCMWLAVDEIGKKIGGYGARADQNQREMVAMFLEALTNDYVGGKGYANSEENEVKIVRVPSLAIFGSSQLEELTSAFSSASTTDGFLQRLVFAPTFAEYVPLKKNFVKPTVNQLYVESLKWIVDLLRNVGGEFSVNDDATQEPGQIIVQVTKEANEYMSALDERRVEMARAGRKMWVRSAVQAMKFAMLEAIGKDPDCPTVKADDLAEATELSDWFITYAETFLASHIADNDTQRDVNKLYHIISSTSGDGISRSELWRKTQTLKSRDRDDHLKTLIESGQVIVDVSTFGGRPRTTYKAVNGPSKEA